MLLKNEVDELLYKLNQLIEFMNNEDILFNLKELESVNIRDLDENHLIGLINILGVLDKNLQDKFKTHLDKTKLDCPNIKTVYNYIDEFKDNELTKLITVYSNEVDTYVPPTKKEQREELDMLLGDWNKSIKELSEILEYEDILTEDEYKFLDENVEYSLSIKPFDIEKEDEEESYFITADVDDDNSLFNTLLEIKRKTNKELDKDLKEWYDDNVSDVMECVYVFPIERKDISIKLKDLISSL